MVRAGDLAIEPDTPKAANFLAIVLSRKGDQTAAERMFRQAIAAQPDLAEAHANLANLLATRRDFRQASHHFDRAIAANPNYGEARHERGMVLIALSSYEKALVDLRAAAGLMPGWTKGPLRWFGPLQ